MPHERLHKVLAHAGIASRRECEELIRQGRVTVDGRAVSELGLLVDPRAQAIKVDGVSVRIRPPVYFLLHKPKGVVCTTAEGERSPRAIDYAPKGAGPLHTVGRLDRDSEGLVILTNDGALTEALAHPRHEVPKTYRVLARGRVSPDAIARLKRGVWLAEGKARASEVRVVSPRPRATLLEIELREGMNREIRRMLAKLGHKVESLVRTGIGPLRIAGMKPGDVRPITREEVEALLRPAPPVKKKKPARPRPAGADAPRAAKPGGGARPERGAREPAAEAKKAAAREERLPDPPPEPPRPKPRYEPDADGVIVVRRPGARFFEEEE
jgi:23S rRNA pseudouridine2605 synthase